MLTPAVRAIGFELDDTLCVYMPVAKQARWRTFEQVLVSHLNRSVEEIDRHYRHAFSEVLQAIHTEPWYSLYKREGHPTRTETMRRMLWRMGMEDADLAERLSWHYLSERERGLHLFGDTLPTLNALKARYPLFVITNGPAYEQRRELALLGLEPFFEVVAIEGEVGIGKPHPEIFRFVERALGLPPESLLFVGNSWEHDVKGALGAGWHAVWLNREGLPHPEPETGVPAISDLYALLIVALCFEG